MTGWPFATPSKTRVQAPLLRSWSEPNESMAQRAVWGRGATLGWVVSGEFFYGRGGWMLQVGFKKKVTVRVLLSQVWIYHDHI